MNICARFAALLDPYVDGELEVEEMLLVQEHLETCPACRAYVDDALAIRAAFPGVEETEVPEGFAGAVLERIRAQGQTRTAVPVAPVKKRRTAPWIRTALPLAACCAIVILLAQGPLTGVRSTKSVAGGEVTADTAAPAEAMDDDAPEAAPEESWDLTAAPKEEADLQPQADIPAPAAEYSALEGAGEAEDGLSRKGQLSDLPGTAGGGADSGSETPTAPVPKMPREPASPENAPVSGDYAAENGQEQKNRDSDPLMAPAEQAAPQAAPEEGWIEYGNVVFACVVYLEREDVGSALEGCEGMPYSNANRPEEGVVGTGYALEPEDFERILEELEYPVEPALNQDRTTELRCIVVRA